MCPACNKRFIAVRWMLPALFILLGQIALSQNFDRRKADNSLKKAHTDSVRVDLLNSFSEQLLQSSKMEDTELGIEYAKQAEDLAEKTGYKRGLLEAYLNLEQLYNKDNDILTSPKKYRDKARKLSVEVSKMQQKVLDENLDKLLEKNKALEIQSDKIDSLNEQNVEKDSLIAEKDTLLTYERLEKLKKEDELKIADLEIKSARQERMFFILFAVSSLLISAFFIYAYLDKRKSNRKLREQKEIIEIEKHRSDELLHNILPHELAEELKEYGYAETRHYSHVTVMFTDFKDFTSISEKMPPRELVAEIDHCFKEFDKIITRHGIEKIKTIGDAYMAAGGLPNEDKDHVHKVVRAAVEIRDFMTELKQQRDAEGKYCFQIRIGIHTGPLVAGVVGVKKFAYDIWGDTVNTAARMEQNSEPGKINISGTTYNYIKADFPCVYRGKVEAKNKGEIDMYFVV